MSAEKKNKTTIIAKADEGESETKHVFIIIVLYRSCIYCTMYGCYYYYYYYKSNKHHIVYSLYCCAYIYLPYYR